MSSTGARLKAAPRILLVATAAALLLSSCATLSLRPFNPRSHGSVYAEWPPHRNAEEWWYVTGVLHGKGNALWLYQFTIFHQAKGLAQGYLMDLALTDYATGKHLFEEYATTSADKAYAKGDTIVFEGSSISLSRSRVSIVAHAKKMSFALSLVPEKPPVWQGDNGVEAMGVRSTPDQMSYYYSFTRLRTHGTISYSGPSGTRLTQNVRGSSWLDRQWGHFSESGWDWFSIRLFDGTDIMLYSFPKTGFREGTIVGPNGGSRRVGRYTYSTDTWQVHGKSRFGLKWTVDLPSIGKRYRLVALSKNDFNPNRVMEYWEGLCKVYDSEGKLVGYAVEETTDSAHPLDGNGNG